MRRGDDLDAESFGKLLAWLGPDRESAGRKYEEVRRRLIRVFLCRGCSSAEELADETLTRGAAKAAQIAETYVGDPAAYFCGIARNVFLEYTRRKPLAPPMRYESTPGKEEQRHEECLDRCLSKLSLPDRDVILSYYREDKRRKIEHRQNLARELGIALNALRIKVCRVRKALYDCVVLCLEEPSATT